MSAYRWMVVQMWSTLFNNKLIAAILLLCVLPHTAFAAIGTITAQDGPTAVLTRDKTKLDAVKGADLEMRDRIDTAATKLNLTFEDDTKVAVTEQSKFVIDEFIYDPNTKQGTLNMRVAMGTVRYASGSIAKNSRENVRLRTPTATISVRGTDFNMTVDELGRSMIILLPSCPAFEPAPKNDEDECPVGEIMVSTDAGMVVLNQAFQATVVASTLQQPTKPRIITNLISLNNLLIIAPPKEFPNEFNVEQKEQVTFLDIDLLEFDDLIQNLLGEDALAYGQLERDYLEGDFLSNMLDLMAVDLGDALAEYDGVLPTIHKYPWIQQKSFYNEEVIDVYAERPPHIAHVITERGVDADLVVVQDGIIAVIQQNGGGSVAINIVQNQ